MHWSEDAVGEFICEIKLEIENKSGLLARTATIISDCGADIDNVSLEDRDGFSLNLIYLLKISGRDHLAMIMRRLRRVTSVM